MTAKDYRAIAAAIAKVRELRAEARGDAVIVLVVHELSKALKAENPRFDAERFWEATHG